MSGPRARIHRVRTAAAADSSGPPSPAATAADRAGRGSPAPAGRTAPGVAGLILLTAVAAGVTGQGAFYRTQQRLLGLLVLAAAAVALAVWPPTRREARLLLAPALALGGWALLDAMLLGVPVGSAVQVALLLLAAVAVLLVVPRLSPADRGTVLTGLLLVGLLVAATGWLGVLGRIDRWAWEGDGLWRAASTLSYPNAAAALLVPLVLVALSRLVDAPGSVPVALAGAGLLVGVGATLSRAGALGLAVGLVVLARLRGPARVGRAAAGPGLGALVALGSLLPSVPAGPARPALAAVGLVAGLAVAVATVRLAGRAVAVTVVGALLAGVAVVAVVALTGSSGPLGVVTDARVTLASPDRSAAAGLPSTSSRTTRSPAPEPARPNCAARRRTASPATSRTPTTNTFRSLPSSVWSAAGPAAGAVVQPQRHRQRVADHFDTVRRQPGQHLVQRGQPAVQPRRVRVRQVGEAHLVAAGQPLGQPALPVVGAGAQPTVQEDHRLGGRRRPRHAPQPRRGGNRMTAPAPWTAWGSWTWRTCRSCCRTGGCSSTT